MEMGMLPCIVILLVSFAHVDARYKAEPVSLVEGDKLQYMDNLPPEYICDSCLKPAKRTEEISRELKLFEKLGMILTEVCHIFPSEFKDKCLKTSDAYVHRTKLLVNGVSNEETICNITGLYLLKSMFLVINGLASVTDEEKIFVIKGNGD